MPGCCFRCFRGTWGHVRRGSRPARQASTGPEKRSDEVRPQERSGESLQEKAATRPEKRSDEVGLQENRGED